MEKKIKTAEYYWMQHQKHYILADFYGFEMAKFNKESIHYKRAYQNLCYHKKKAREAETKAKAMTFSDKMR